MLFAPSAWANNAGIYHPNHRRGCLRYHSCITKAPKVQGWRANDANSRSRRYITIPSYRLLAAIDGLSPNARRSTAGSRPLALHRIRNPDYLDRHAGNCSDHMEETLPASAIGDWLPTYVLAADIGARQFVSRRRVLGRLAYKSIQRPSNHEAVHPVPASNNQSGLPSACPVSGLSRPPSFCLFLDTGQSAHMRDRHRLPAQRAWLLDRRTRWCHASSSPSSRRAA